MTTIKITELTDIGANLASSTVLPVVNMSGTPTTQKTILGNIANVVLAGAGGNYVAATKATTANTVTINAQPNITSTGNLIGLTVSNANGVVNFTTTANVTLGAVGNLHIAGGTTDQLLTTDGAGNLSWTTVSGGNGAPSGSNTQIQFNDAGAFGGNTGFTFDKTTGILAAPFADVSGVANIVGGGATVATKSVLNVASTFGSNDPQDPASAQAVRGRVTGANLAKTRNYVTGVTGQYLVTGTNASEFIKAGILGVVGDQTTTADGAVVAYLDGDGGLTTANAAYAVSMKNSTPNSGFNYGLDLQFISLNLGGVTTSTFKQADIRFNNGVKLVANTAGNISIDGNLMTSAEVVASGVIQSGTGLTTGGYLSVNGTADLHDTTVDGNLSATGNITATNIGNIANINLTGSNANVLYGNGVFAAVAGGGNTGNVTFNDINVIGTGNLHLQPDPANAGAYLDIFLTAGPDIHISGGSGYSGAVILGTDEEANVAILPGGNVAIQAGNVAGTKTWTFDTAGNVTIPGSIIGTNTIEFDNRATGNGADINLYSADDILIQARDRDIGSTSEGGDINIFAGDSAEDSDTSAGDIVIEAGAGGASNIDYGGAGGLVRVEAGRGGAAVGANISARSGGDLTLRAGHAGNNGGNIDLGNSGGDVNINAGDSTGNGNPGGTIYLVSGAADASGLAGDVVIQAGGFWTFDGNGNLTLPGNTFAVNYANGTQVSIGGGANTGNVTFSDQIVIGTGSNDGTDGLYLAPGNASIANSAVQYLRVRGGDVATHIHLDTGNNAFYDQYFGNDAKYVKLEAGDAGNVVIGTDDANGNQYSWSFTSDGNLILAGGDSVIQSIANSSLDPVNPNVSTMIFTPDQGYSSQSLVLDPTAPGHIHLRAPGANIDEPLANIFLGGEDSSFEVGYYNGAAPNLFVHSGGNTWTFDTAGNLTTPSNLVIGTGAGSGSRIFQYDDGLEIVGEGANSVVLMGWTANISAPDSVATIAMNYPSGGEGNILFAVGNNATTVNYWLFDNTGNTTFPRNIAPNTTDPILTIVGGANPTIRSDEFDLTGPANLGISALTTTFTGFTGDAIKIYPDDGEISSTANLQIWANSGGNTEYSWTFDTDGTLTLPQGSQITETANTSVNITANANTWAFGVDGNLTVPGSLINDTSIVLSAPAVFNICTIATAGSGYNTGSSLKATTGGSGTGMTVGIGYGLSNQLTSVSVVNPGTGYVNGDVITVSEGTGGTFVITKYNVLANQTNNNTVQTNLTFANNTLTLPIYGEIASNANMTLTTNYSNAGNTSSWTFDTTGNLTLPDTTTINATVSITLEANDTGNITGLSVIGDSHANLYAHGNITLYANTGGAGSTWTFDNSGNLTLPGNTFAVNYANGTQVPVGVTQDITSNGNMSIMTYDGNLKYVNNATVEPSTGNITTIGNISATGNISANNFTGNGGGLSNVATKVAGSWTLASGNNTVNISVPLNGTYSIWINGNIPNGIVTYTATAVVTNTNVPVLGEQYGWYYVDGNALVLTSIPNQFVGTQGAISNATPYLGNTANVFTFGITNNSGANAVVNYGYTKL